MSIELAYLFITPYTLQKSRTGGVIARLLSRTDLDLVGAKIVAPTQEFADAYADYILKLEDCSSSEVLQLLSDYVKENFGPHDGKYQRIMMLLFKGENARKKLQEIVGVLKSGIRTGETIRDTYSEYVLNRDGSVKYFEPAVIMSPTEGNADKDELKFISQYLKTEPNIIEKPLLTHNNDPSKRTLVIIKPDNWRHPSTRPGNIIDMLSKTGLRMVGCKLYRMSIEDALEFYGPVQGVLREKLSPRIGKQAAEILHRELKLDLDDNDVLALTNSIGIKFADDQFSQIVEFMSGSRPEKCKSDEKSLPGRSKCLVLIYQGEDAVNKIRDVLGPTDPSKAPGGTIRRDFGTDVMVNTAHASDSFDNAKREMRIIKIAKNSICDVIDDYVK